MIRENPLSGHLMCSLPTSKCTWAAKISDYNQQVAWQADLQKCQLSDFSGLLLYYRDTPYVMTQSGWPAFPALIL